MRPVLTLEKEMEGECDCADEVQSLEMTCEGMLFKDGPVKKQEA